MKIFILTIAEQCYLVREKQGTRIYQELFTSHRDFSHWVQFEIVTVICNKKAFTKGLEDV